MTHNYQTGVCVSIQSLSIVENFDIFFIVKNQAGFWLQGRLLMKHLNRYFNPIQHFSNPLLEYMCKIVTDSNIRFCFGFMTFHSCPTSAVKNSGCDVTMGDFWATWGQQTYQ